MKSIIGLFSLFATLLLAGCDSQVGPDNTRTQSLELSIAITPDLSNVAAKSGSGLVLTDGTNILDITSVGIVLREIELERVDGFKCDAFDDDESGESESDDGDHEDEDECEEFETGPLLLEPALDGSVEHVASIEILEGFYKELKFQIHKVSGEDDIDFITAHPAFDDISIRVEGTFNDASFVFTQDLDEEQEIEFDSPFEVSADADSTNITLQLDLSTWFVTDTDELVDPAMANDGEDYEGLVERNIKRSIKVFEDDDHNGRDDDHEDDSGHDSDDD